MNDTDARVNPRTPQDIGSFGPERHHGRAFVSEDSSTSAAPSSEAGASRTRTGSGEALRRRRLDRNAWARRASRSLLAGGLLMSCHLVDRHQIWNPCARLCGDPRLK